MTMETIQVFKGYVDICSTLVGFKIVKIINQPGVVDHYEFKLSLFAKMNDDGDFKRSGETFLGHDMAELMFRLSSYVSELDRVGVAEFEVNPDF